MSTPIRQVKGIGLFTEQALASAGITSVESLAEATIEQLVSVPGFGPKRAELVIEKARQLMADVTSELRQERPDEVSSPVDLAHREEKKKKTEIQKGKDKQKGKPKDKKKKKDKKDKSQKKKEKKGKEKSKGKKKTKK